MKKGDYFIDISAYQPDTNSAVIRGGTRNTVIKVTEGSYWSSGYASEQTRLSDTQGYYHFARFGGNSALAINEADYFLSRLPNRSVKYLVLDYEDGASSNKQANTNAVLAFMDRVKQAGYTPIYYSYVPFTATNIYLDQVIKKYPKSLWLAGYAYGYNNHPNYDSGDESIFKRNLANYGISYAFEHTRWYQFTSTANGSLDKNYVLINDENIVETILEGVKNMKNYFVAAEGKPGALIMANKMIPIASIGTYKAFAESGDFVPLKNIDAGDYDRIMSALNNNNIVNAIKASK